MKILVTGGAGYIGSHICLELLVRGYEVLVLDNLTTASPKGLEAVERLSRKPVTFYKGDVRDKNLLNHVFSTNNIDGVIHLAALKSSPQSIKEPTAYYSNNLAGTLTLLEVMTLHRCKNLIISSSAAVYETNSSRPISEDSPLAPQTPYGRSKLMAETLAIDLYQSDPSWNITILRYFNPVGAHPSGDLGECPHPPSSNLWSNLIQVATGALPQLLIFGGDYDTPDGTAIRDYIHIADLTQGHLVSLNCWQEQKGLTIYNLGTGQGHSVLDMVRCFSHISGRDIPYKIVDRRPGDASCHLAAVDKIRKDLHWQAQLNLQEMCQDAWRWHQRHPNGY